MYRRVRTGCITCRKRRVKCDEGKPFCFRCRSANFICEGYKPRQRVSQDGSLLSTSPSGRLTPLHGDSPSTGLSLRHRNWRREQLPLFHHFVTIAAPRLFRNYHVAFWRDEVVQMSYELDIIYEAVLAIGAIHRSSFLALQNGNLREVLRFKCLAFRTYGNTVRLLRNYLGQITKLDISPVLIVLVLLTYFECFQENTKAALQHLWVAIQLLGRDEDGMSENDVTSMTPLFDAILRLDFLAQKLVPYACSSFSRGTGLAIMEKPFWNRPSPRYICQSDQIAAERHLLIQLVCGHSRLSRVIWGCWCPTSERPSREELLGFYSEMQLWKASSRAIFARCDGLDNIEAFDSVPLDQRPMPPPACHLLSTDTALNIMMYNAYLGCALAMISTTDENPVQREKDIFNLVYQCLCIAAGLIENHNWQSDSPYKPCGAISTGISLYLYHGFRRSFSHDWQEWTITALRLIGREGLSNGFTKANALDIMSQLEAKMQYHEETQGGAIRGDSPLGHIRDRLIPLLLPHEDGDDFLAFYLRYGNAEVQGDERTIQVAAKATWTQDTLGLMTSLRLDVYDLAIGGYAHLPNRPQAAELFHSWRREVEKGWHGYLATEVEKGFLRMEGRYNIS